MSETKNLLNILNKVEKKLEEIIEELKTVDKTLVSNYLQGIVGHLERIRKNILTKLEEVKKKGRRMNKNMSGNKITKKNNKIWKQLLESVKENAIIEKTDDKIIAYVFYPYKGKNRKQYVAESNNLSIKPLVLFKEITEKIYNSLFISLPEKTKTNKKPTKKIMNKVKKMIGNDKRVNYNTTTILTSNFGDWTDDIEINNDKLVELIAEELKQERNNSNE